MLSLGCTMLPNYYCHTKINQTIRKDRKDVVQVKEDEALSIRIEINREV